LLHEALIKFLALISEKKSRVIKITSKGIILALVVQFDLKVHQFAIKTTSLYRVLEKDIFMSPIDGLHIL
jgi:hypothetical protein